MNPSDWDEALDRLIGAAPGEAAPEAIAADRELMELAGLAQALRSSGREHARSVDAAAGWAQLSASIERTPQSRGWFGWWRGNAAPLFQQQVAPFPAMALAAVVLGLSLLLALPRENASAALLRDVDAMERTIAAASAHGSITEEDRVELERTTSAVLDRVSDETILRSVPSAQVEALAARLQEARRTLVTLPEAPTSTTSSGSALASLNAASGFIESSLSASVPPTASPAPPKAAAKASDTATPQPTSAPTRTAAAAPTTGAKTPTITPTAAPTSRPATATPAATERGNDDRDNRNGNSSGPNRAAPSATPNVATLLDTVSPVCERVYNHSTLGACRKAVEAAMAWCDQLSSDGARGCVSAVEDKLESAERRVDNLSDGCKRLSNSRSQKACKDSIEMSSYRPSRGESGNTGKGDRGD